MNPQDLVLIYKMYIRLCLEIGVPVWSLNLTVVQVNSIERLQRRALGVITGTFPDTMSYAQLLRSLGVVRLSERPSVLCNKFANSLLISHRHHHLLPETRQTISRHTLRKSLQLNTPKMRTERYRQSPIPHFTQILNSNL